MLANRRTSSTCTPTSLGDDDSAVARATRGRTRGDAGCRTGAASPAARSDGTALAGGPAGAAAPVAPQPRRGSRMKRRALATAALVVLAVCVTVTLIEGRPRHLPGIALGSPVLLHAERALALFAVTVAMLSIGVQAARGLPIELSTSGL